MPSSTRFMVTLLNYTEEEYQYIITNVPGNCTYLVVGKEVCPTTGTPHLQMFVQFPQASRKTFPALKRLFNCDRIHLDRCNGLSEQCAAYCKKDGVFEEFGEFAEKGKRTDIEAFKVAVKAGLSTLQEVREEHSSLYSRAATFCREYLQDQLKPPEVDPHPLRPWQANLVEMLRRPGSDREIIFIVDRTGNTGKSWFSKYYCQIMPDKCQILYPGKKADMAYMIDVSRSIFFLDCPRSKQNEFLQYDIMEEIKNRMVFNTKYESYMKFLKKNHLIVFMNEQPDESKLSADRYKIIVI